MTIASALPLMEQLENSTLSNDLLSPVPLRQTDWLRVNLDRSGRKFLMWPQALSPCQPDDPELLFENGPFLKPIYAPVGVDANERFWQRLPEADSRVKPLGVEWEVAATDFTALVLRHAWPQERIIWGEGAEELYRYLRMRFLAQSSKVRLQAEFKAHGTVPALPEHFRDHEDLPLAPYQRTALAMSLGQEGFAFFMDKGTGKTATAVARVCHDAAVRFANGGNMLKVLVVCPNQVRANWAVEAGRFATNPGKVGVVRGDKMRRLTVLTEAITSQPGLLWSMTVVGYDTVAIDIDVFEKPMWDLVICDESHYFKERTTRRWRAMKRLRERSDKRVILTGTPISNWMMDLWTQLEFLGEGLSGFQSAKRFRSFHGDFQQVTSGGRGVEKLKGVNNVPLMQERLSRVSFSVSKREAGLNLPDKAYDVHEVEMTRPQADAYRRMEKDLIVEIEEAMSGDRRTMEANHVLTRLLRLAQITSGFLTWDIEELNEHGAPVFTRKVEQVENNPKVEAVLSFLRDPERDPKGKMIIWATFREDIRVLEEKISELGVGVGSYFGDTSQTERDLLVSRFNGDPELKVLIANPATASEGLNLLGYDYSDPAIVASVREGELPPSYCDHMVFFSQSWNMVHRSQSEDRAHRRGTVVPLRITDLVVPATIDEAIRTRVTKKRHSASVIQDVGEVLKSVLGVDLELDQ